MKTDLEDKIQSPAARKFVKKIRSQLAELFRLDPDTFEVHAFYTHGSSAYLNILLSFELPGPKVEWSGVRSIIYDELKVIYKESGLEFPKQAPFVTKSGRRVDISMEIDRNELEKIQLNPGAHFNDDARNGRTPGAARKPPKVAAAGDDFEVHTWFERDRAHVELRNKKTDETLIEWWDDDVHQAVEDGFLDPHDWKGSALKYANSLNMLWGESRPEKKNPKSKKQKQRAVSLKIRKLMREGYPQDQAVAIALNMERKKKLGVRGGYKRNPIRDDLMAEALAALAGLLRYPERSEDVREEVLAALEAEGYWNINQGVTKKGDKFLFDICDLEDLPE